MVEIMKMKKIKNMICFVFLLGFTSCAYKGAVRDIAQEKSSVVVKDKKERCVVSYKDEVIYVEPIRGSNLGFGGLINSLEITTENGETSLYEINGITKGGWDNSFVRIEGSALTKNLIYDDYRGIAFTEDGISLDGEANFASYFKGSYVDAPDTTLICEKAHDGQRHSLKRY